MSSKKYVRRCSLITTFISLFLVIGLWATSTQTGWLIILDGTSSAGKSSVARHLKSKLFHKTNLSFSYESLDDFNTRKEEAEAKQKEEEKAASKSKSKSRSAASKSAASKSLERSADDDARSIDDSKSQKSDSDDDDDDSQADYLQYLKDLSTKDGKHVIGDTVLRDEQDIKEYNEIIGKGETIICAMVYCPATEVPRRVEARNLSGNKDEERTLYQAIAQIPDMFTITQKPTKQTIDSLTKKEVEAILKPLKTELIKDNKKKRKAGKKEDNVPQTLQALRSSLAPKKGKNSYIQPKKLHDVVAINSRKNGPAVAAQKIAAYTIGRMNKNKAAAAKKSAKITMNHRTS